MQNDGQILSTSDRNQSRWRRFVEDIGGGPFVEFLMVLPVLLGLSFGAVELTYLYVTYSTMLDAARDSARQLADGIIGEDAAATLAGARLPTGREITVNVNDPADSDPCDVQVEISIPFDQATATNFVDFNDLMTVAVTMRRIDCG